MNPFHYLQQHISTIVWSAGSIVAAVGSHQFMPNNMQPFADMLTGAWMGGQCFGVPGAVAGGLLFGNAVKYPVIRPFIPAITTSMIGAFIAGPTGALIGFALGAVDMTAHHFKWYQTPHLTITTFGAIGGYQVSTTIFSPIPFEDVKLGAAAAFPALIMSISYQLLYVGGAAIGASIGAIISSEAVSSSLLIEVAEFSQPLRVGLDSYEFAANFNATKTQSLMIEPLLLLTPLSFIAQAEFLLMADTMQEVRLVSYNSPFAKHQYATALVSFTMHMVKNAIVVYACEVIKDYYSSEESYFIYKKLETQWSGKQMPLSLVGIQPMNDTLTSKALTQNMQSDVNKVYYEGFSLLIDGYMFSLAGAYSANYLASLGRGGFLVGGEAVGVMLLLGQWAEFISHRVLAFDVPIKDLESQMISLIEHTTANAASYVQMRGDHLIKAKLDELYVKLVQLKNAKMYYREADSTLSDAGPWIAFIGNSVAIGINLVLGYMSTSTVTSVTWMAQDFSAAMLWGSKNAGAISQNKGALARLKDLQAMFASSLTEMNTPDVKLEFGYTVEGSDTSRLCFKDFSVSVMNDTIVYADNVCTSGRINAVTGPSGCGKTSLFKVISGFPDAAITGSGTIKFDTQDGAPPLIVTISQHRYLPPGFKLIEHITGKFGDSANDPYKANIEARLAEIGAPDLIQHLYSVDHWDGRLSGGQYQKIRIVGLTLEENSTGIMLLDEAFVGLDKDSQVKAKKMLLKYLPHWTLMIIDHGSNCGDGFYDSRLDFKDNENDIRILVSERCIDDKWVQFDGDRQSATCGSDAAMVRIEQLANDSESICPVGSVLEPECAVDA